ncbi:hypothetical protein [Actinotalea sp. Marseille-Q4924]|uniref:hypothetical protein n=1 Tax=Actinotalea sp. Marseille-Q4924 TaxID=2866571 RepID=UPI001CE4A72C|nr:hypothetical protein [Actinotalea sp. Marseille-Q4924]
MAHTSGMDIEEARRAKAELAGFLRDTQARRPSAQALDAPLVSLGLAPRPDGGHAVALRYRLGVPTARMLARRAVEHAGPSVDVRRTGRIRAVPTTGPRPPVVTARAVGETGRVRPLRPGVSVAHVDVTAGTLGAFVTVDGRLHALSNHHVLVGSPAAREGDAVLQPGPADGGRDPEDRIGSLARFVPLDGATTAFVDAAVAALEDDEVEVTYPSGPVTGTARVVGAEEVEKIGRTTGTTRGRVTAFELDDVVVGYGPEVGDVSFDDQIEVEGLARGPFSRGGDSGSLVYVPATGQAVGLLFAGSETGGENGAGLTYLNPIDTVLEALGAELRT